MDANQDEKATLSDPQEVSHTIAEDTNMDPPANATSIEEQQQPDIKESIEQKEETPAPDAAVAKEEEETTDLKEDSHHDEEVVASTGTDEQLTQQAAEDSKHALKEASASPAATTEPATIASTEEQDPMEGMETNADAPTTTASNAENQEIEEYTPMEGITHQNDDTSGTPAAADNDAPPFLSAPASWQIPVAAFHQQQKSEQPQQQQPTKSNKASMRKERYESRVKENKYDIEAWTWLINEAQQTGDLEVIREMYERFLNVFPTSVSVQARGIEGAYIYIYVCVWVCGCDLLSTFKMKDAESNILEMCILTLLLAKALACLPRIRTEILQL